MISINHIYNLQVKILNYKVDGQLRTDPTQLFEFNGCLWHGCPRCIPDRFAPLPRSGISAKDAYEKTMQKEADLRAAG